MINAYKYVSKQLSANPTSEVIENNRILLRVKMKILFLSHITALYLTKSLIESRQKKNILKISNKSSSNQQSITY